MSPNNFNEKEIKGFSQDHINSIKLVLAPKKEKKKNQLGRVIADSNQKKHELLIRWDNTRQCREPAQALQLICFGQINLTAMKLPWVQKQDNVTS